MYPITYITDCSDGNARARLSTRIGALFGQSPTIVAADGPDPESFAALTLLDCLRSAESCSARKAIRPSRCSTSRPATASGRTACRSASSATAGTSSPAPSTPARSPWYAGSSAIDRVYVTDIREVVAAGRTIRPAEIEKIADTQFRSLWYLPLLAKWVADGRAVPSTETAIPEVARRRSRS